MFRSLSPIVLALGLTLGACKPAESSSPPIPSSGKPAAVVVPNTEAQPGDTTECPYSGRTFVVKADSPKLDYGGRTYVFCSEKARDAVAADPARYLGEP